MGKKAAQEAEAKGKAKSKAAAKSAASSSHACTNKLGDIVNAAHLMALEADMKVIMESPYFKNVLNEDPHPLGKGGIVAAYSDKDYKLGMASGSYTCGENFFRHNPQYSARARIPVLESRLKCLCDDEFKNPTAYPRTLKVAVPSESWCPQTCRGQWMSIDPEEFRRAYVKAIARDISDKKPEEVIKAWKSHCLRVVFCFEKHETELDRYYATTTLREKIADDYVITRTTIYQRILELQEYKVKFGGQNRREGQGQDHE